MTNMITRGTGFKPVLVAHEYGQIMLPHGQAIRPYGQIICPHSLVACPVGQMACASGLVAGFIRHVASSCGEAVLSLVTLAGRMQRHVMK
jgi:hypothetical protein